MQLSERSVTVALNALFDSRSCVRKRIREAQKENDVERFNIANYQLRELQKAIDELTAIEDELMMIKEAKVVECELVSDRKEA